MKNETKFLNKKRILYSSELKFAFERETFCYDYSTITVFNKITIKNHTYNIIILEKIN